MVNGNKNKHGNDPGTNLVIDVVSGGKKEIRPEKEALLKKKKVGRTNKIQPHAQYK